MVEFDLFPAGHKKLVGVQRALMTVLEKGAEEPEQPKDSEELTELKDKKEEVKKKKCPSKRSAPEFRSLPEEETAEAQLCKVKLGKQRW